MNLTDLTFDRSLVVREVVSGEAPVGGEDLQTVETEEPSPCLSRHLLSNILLDILHTEVRRHGQ